ncbi:sulfotransferase family 2 domain-containing protein [Dyella sedimenti]|uniref:sulfotransferase family 2 domain-containing protein n=1 Tax=Dyella sedimenti TaxID=2919947 RepID=UPI001FA9D363|nr:sulfotransferase family 2 domain-containing protein [Dyella sedimenti]
MKYFIHIPKTAGTSLRAAVFGAKLGCGKVRAVYSAEDYAALTDNGGCESNTLFFGHFSFGIHQLLGDASPQYVTVIRNPVDRVVSLYNHHMRFPSSPYHAMLNEQRLSLIDFVEGCITPETNNEVVRNLSASYDRLPLWCDRVANRWWQLSRGLPTRQINEKFRLRLALRNVKRYFKHVGLVEEIEVTGNFLEQWMHLRPGSVVIPRENEYRGERVTLSAGERVAIENANELDLELYQCAHRGELSGLHG